MSLKLFHVVESADNSVLGITSFLVKENEAEAEKQAEKHFIDLINEHTIPVTLDDESEKYWLDKKVYTNHSYKLELVKGYTKN